MVDDNQSFVFKMPFPEDETSQVDLKWVGEQSKQVGELMEQFLSSYRQLASKQNHPPELLRGMWNVISALADYQIVLQEQQSNRQTRIRSEADLQEVMGQLENFMQQFRDR